MNQEKDNQKNVTKPDRQAQLVQAKSKLNNQKLTKTKLPAGMNDTSAVQVAKTRSIKDIILWLIAVVALISITLVNTWLPGIWLPANDVWVRIALIAGLVILAIICLALTHQGAAFKVLLKDAGIELRRVTWPTKNETFTYTWQTLVVIAIVGFIIWLLDNFFNTVVGFFIGQ